MLRLFLTTGTSMGWLFNLAILLGLAVGATIATVLAVRYFSAKAATRDLTARFAGGIVLTARSSNELQAAFAQLGDAVPVPRYVTVVTDREGVAFWGGQTRLRLIGWAQIRTIEVGTAFIERPTSSVVVVASHYGKDVRVEFVPHERAFSGGMGFDGMDLRALIDRLRGLRP